MKRTHFQHQQMTSKAAGGLGALAVESTTSSAWWIFEQIGEAMYSAYSSIASLFSTADVPAVQQEGEGLVR